jgi:hypothetical protein
VAKGAVATASLALFAGVLATRGELDVLTAAVTTALIAASLAFLVQGLKSLWDGRRMRAESNGQRRS